MVDASLFWNEVWWISLGLNEARDATAQTGFRGWGSGFRISVAGLQGLESGVRGLRFPDRPERPID